MLYHMYLVFAEFLNNLEVIVL